MREIRSDEIRFLQGEGLRSWGFHVPSQLISAYACVCSSLIAVVLTAS